MASVRICGYILMVTEMEVRNVNMDFGDLTFKFGGDEGEEAAVQGLSVEVETGAHEVVLGDLIDVPSAALEVVRTRSILQCIEALKIQRHRLHNGIYNF